MILIVALIYALVLVFITRIKIEQKPLIFSVVFLTSGFVYVSSILFLLVVINYHFFVKRPNFKQIIQFLILAFLLVSINFFGQDNGYQLSELVQILVFVFLLISLNLRNFFTQQFLKSVCIGLLIGSIIMGSNFMIREFVFNDLTQESLIYFSISGTFNYSAYFMFFGLILVPSLLFKKTSIKVGLFLLYAVSLYIIQARSSFLLGIISFLFLTLEIKNTTRFLLLSLIFLVAINYFLDSSLVSKDNQNDIIYSITNFENNTSNLERLEMFLFSFEHLENNPLGVGVGNTEIALNKTSIDHPHAHNTLANWIYEMGYVGILLFVLFFYTMIRCLKGKIHKIPKASLVIFLFILVTSQFSSLQYNILVTCTTYLGLVLLKLLSERKLAHA